MKKTYSKPEILFESFTMSTNIAAGCEKIVGNPSKGSCAVNSSGGISVFDATVGAACAFTPGDMGTEEDMYDGFCYHVPTEYNNLFNS